MQAKIVAFETLELTFPPSLLAQSALNLKSARVAGTLIQYTKAYLMELAQVLILPTAQKRGMFCGAGLDSCCRERERKRERERGVVESNGEWAELRRVEE